MLNYRRTVSDLCRQYPEGEARALARWLFEECFGMSQTDLLLDKDNHLSAHDLDKLQEIVGRLLRHEPIQYILGHTTFCGHRLLVAPGALIPRPETEQLVGHILASLQSAESPAGAFRGTVLDVGTGSGCIALSLALALPESSVTGWDVSPEALAVARRNADLYPQAKLVLEQCDILCPPPTDRRWDLVVSNPPYVRRSEAAEMEHNVLDHEPHVALFVPDDDALRFYRAIALFAQAHLNDGGQLWFEINRALGAETARLVVELGFTAVEVVDDTFGNPRFIKAIRKE